MPMSYAEAKSQLKIALNYEARVLQHVLTSCFLLAKPSRKLCLEWIGGTSHELQNFAAENQKREFEVYTGIGVLDAARVLMDNATEDFVKDFDEDEDDDDEDSYALPPKGLKAKVAVIAKAKVKAKVADPRPAKTGRPSPYKSTRLPPLVEGDEDF